LPILPLSTEGAGLHQYFDSSFSFRPNFAHIYHNIAATYIFKLVATDFTVTVHSIIFRNNARMSKHAFRPGHLLNLLAT
jgi:hypothetical protein